MMISRVGKMVANKHLPALLEIDASLWRAIQKYILEMEMTKQFHHKDLRYDYVLKI